MDAARGARDDILRAELLEPQRRLERALEVVADRDDAEIEIAHAERLEKARIRRIRDERVRHEGQREIHLLLILVDREDLMIELIHLFRDVAAIAAESDNQD